MTDPWFIVEHVADEEQEAAATRLQETRAAVFGDSRG